MTAVETAIEVVIATVADIKTAADGIASLGTVRDHQGAMEDRVEIDSETLVSPHHFTGFIGYI